MGNYKLFLKSNLLINLVKTKAYLSTNVMKSKTQDAILRIKI